MGEFSLCKCGCGNKVYGGHIYSQGHRPPKIVYDIYFLNVCECGCGEILYGNKRFVRGHHNRCRTDETIEKLRKASIRFKKSSETLEKMRIANSGKKRNPEQIKRISDSKLGNKNPNYKKHNSFATEWKKGQLPPISSSWAKGSWYDSPLQGKIWMRSPWEVEYAKYLDSNDISWLYEWKTFDIETTTYTPDFYIPILNSFVEIKGWMKPEQQEKIDRTIDIYNINLQVLYRKELLRIGCDV